MEKRKLQWHPGFTAALRIVFESDRKYLEIYEEYQLSRKPLQIDVLIIRKLKDIEIKKSIGRLFRGHNIIEYKSPEDYLSINDFYKVYGYACVYQSNTDRVKEIDPEGLTLTFVCSRYPREMLRHLEETRGMSVENGGNGIYYLKGDPIPMQLLITPQLSEEENYWLKNLRTDLKAGPEIRTLMSNYEKHKKSKDYEAVMNLITRANWEQMEVEKKMCDALKELFAEELEEADSRGRAEGLSQGLNQGLNQGIQLTKQVLRLASQGDSPEEIARKCDVSLEQVRMILE
nr:3-isopropylmalate dehydrogenase [uncultured Mediterraneibacter sp.]